MRIITGKDVNKVVQLFDNIILKVKDQQEWIVFKKLTCNMTEEKEFLKIMFEKDYPIYSFKDTSKISGVTQTVVAQHYLNFIPNMNEVPASNELKYKFRIRAEDPIKTIFQNGEFNRIMSKHLIGERNLISSHFSINQGIDSNNLKQLEKSYIKREYIKRLEL